MTNDTIQFMKQVNRRDVLTNITKNTHKSGRELFELLMTENGKRKMDDKSSRQGKVFETICQIVIAFKCVIGFHYTEIYDGLLSVLKRVVSVKKSVHSIVGYYITFLQYIKLQRYSRR